MVISRCRPCRTKMVHPHPQPLSLGSKRVERASLDHDTAAGAFHVFRRLPRKTHSDEAKKKQFESENPNRRSDYEKYIAQAFTHISECLKSYTHDGKLRTVYGSGYSNDDDLGHVEVNVLTVTSASGERGAIFSPIASSGFGCGCVTSQRQPATSRDLSVTCLLFEKEAPETSQIGSFDYPAIRPQRQEAGFSQQVPSTMISQPKAFNPSCNE